jgi:starch synthase
LNDTIEHGVSGFLFEEPSAHAFAQAVQEALAGWERRGWRSLQAHCMGRDHSWTRSATEYERIYQWAIGAG